MIFEIEILFSQVESIFLFRTENFDKNSEYAKAWKKDDDGGVVSDQPRITIGDPGMGPQGGYVTRYILKTNERVLKNNQNV